MTLWREECRGGLNAAPNCRRRLALAVSFIVLLLTTNVSSEAPARLQSFRGRRPGGQNYETGSISSEKVFSCCSLLVEASAYIPGSYLPSKRGQLRGKLTMGPVLGRHGLATPVEATYHMQSFAPYDQDLVGFRRCPRYTGPAARVEVGR